MKNRFKSLLIGVVLLCSAYCMFCLRYYIIIDTIFYSNVTQEECDVSGHKSKHMIMKCDKLILYKTNPNFLGKTFINIYLIFREIYE